MSNRWTGDENALFARLLSEGVSAREVKAAFPDKSWHSVRCKFRRAGVSESNSETPGAESEGREYEQTGDTARVSVTGLLREVKDLDDLMRVCRVDGTQWEVIGYRQKAYQGFIKNKEKQIETVQLFSVSASLKAKRLQCAVREELDALVTEARSRMPRMVFTPSPITQATHLASINLNDLHMGKYAWHKESGSNYDVEIGERLTLEALEDLIDKLSPWCVGKIVLTVGSDLLNSDNSANMTTGGTPQTTDGRQQRTFRRTWQLMRRVVLRLLEVAPVHIVVVNGNHDRDSSFAVGEILEVAFESYPDITIDNGPARRKYVEFGRCLMGYTHGDEIKTAAIPGVMAEQCAEAWGRTTWRVMETGHLHQQLVTEFPGVIVRVNPALCAPEDWHASKGFVGKLRALHAQVWHRDDGNVAQLSSVPVEPDRAMIVKVG